MHSRSAFPTLSAGKTAVGLSARKPHGFLSIVCDGPPWQQKVRNENGIFPSHLCSTDHRTYTQRWPSAYLNETLSAENVLDRFTFFE